MIREEEEEITSYLANQVAIVYDVDFDSIEGGAAGWKKALQIEIEPDSHMSHRKRIRAAAVRVLANLEIDFLYYRRLDIDFDPKYDEMQEIPRGDYDMGGVYDEEEEEEDDIYGGSTQEFVSDEDSQPSSPLLLNDDDDMYEGSTQGAWPLIFSDDDDEEEDEANLSTQPLVSDEDEDSQTTQSFSSDDDDEDSRSSSPLSLDGEDSQATQQPSDESSIWWGLIEGKRKRGKGKDKILNADQPPKKKIIQVVKRDTTGDIFDANRIADEFPILRRSTRTVELLSGSFDISDARHPTSQKGTGKDIWVGVERVPTLVQNQSFESDRIMISIDTRALVGLGYWDTKGVVYQGPEASPFWKPWFEKTLRSFVDGKRGMHKTMAKRLLLKLKTPTGMTDKEAEAVVDNFLSRDTTAKTVTLIRLRMGLSAHQALAFQETLMEEELSEAGRKRLIAILKNRMVLSKKKEKQLIKDLQTAVVLNSKALTEAEITQLLYNVHKGEVLDNIAVKMTYYLWDIKSEDPLFLLNQIDEGHFIFYDNVPYSKYLKAIVYIGYDRGNTTIKQWVDAFNTKKEIYESSWDELSDEEEEEEEEELNYGKEEGGEEVEQYGEEEEYGWWESKARKTPVKMEDFAEAGGTRNMRRDALAALRFAKRFPMVKRGTHINEVRIGNFPDRDFMPYSMIWVAPIESDLPGMMVGDMENYGNTTIMHIDSSALVGLGYWDIKELDDQQERLDILGDVWRDHTIKFLAKKSNTPPDKERIKKVLEIVSIVRNRLANTPAKQKILTQALLQGISWKDAAIVMFNLEDIIVNDPVLIFEEFGEAVFVFYDDINYDEYRSSIVHLETYMLRTDTKQKAEVFDKNNITRFARLRDKTDRLKKMEEVRIELAILKVQVAFKVGNRISRKWSLDKLWILYAAIISEAYENPAHDEGKYEGEPMRITKESRQAIKDARKAIRKAEKKGLMPSPELTSKLNRILKEEKERQARKKEKEREKEEAREARLVKAREGHENMRLIPKPIHENLFVDTWSLPRLKDKKIINKMAKKFPILLRGKIVAKVGNMWLASKKTGWSEDIVKSMVGKEDPIFEIRAETLSGFGYWNIKALKNMSDWKTRKEYWWNKQVKKKEKKGMESKEIWRRLNLIWESNFRNPIWLMQAVKAGNFMFYNSESYKKFLATISKKRYTFVSPATEEFGYCSSSASASMFENKLGSLRMLMIEGGKRKRGKGKEKEEVDVEDPNINITGPDDLFPALWLHKKINFDAATTACIFGQLHDWHVISQPHSTQSIVVLGKYENVNMLIKLGLLEPESLRLGDTASLIPPLEYERRIYEKFINPLVLKKNTPNLRMFVGTVMCNILSLTKVIKKKVFNSELVELEEAYIKKYREKPVDAVSLVLEGFKEFEILYNVVTVFKKGTNQDYPTTAKHFIEIANNMEKRRKAMGVILLKSPRLGFTYVMKNMPSFLFQILYTLNCLKETGLKHNDLHLANVAIEANTEGTLFHTNSIMYVTANVKYVINVKNALVKLYDWDQGFSKVVGNNETLDNNPEDGLCMDYGRCNEYLNPNYDIMHVLAQMVITSNFRLASTIGAILGWAPLDTVIWADKWGSFGRPTIKEQTAMSISDLITTREEIKAFNPDRLLASPFFDVFRLENNPKVTIRRDMVFFLPSITQKEREATLDLLPVVVAKKRQALPFEEEEEEEEKFTSANDESTYISFDWGSLTKLRKKCLKEFILGPKLGTGFTGIVYEACKGKDCAYALKVRRVEGFKGHGSSNVNTFEEEVKFTKEASELGVSPKLIDSWVCESVEDDVEDIQKWGFILMEKWDMTLMGYFIKRRETKLPVDLMERRDNYVKLLKSHGINHGDMGNSDNTMINVNEAGLAIDIAIIDFDRAFRGYDDNDTSERAKAFRKKRSNKRNRQKLKKEYSSSSFSASMRIGDEIIFWN